MKEQRDLERDIDHARELARYVHRKHTRRGGDTPYIEHVEAVAAAVPDYCQPAAWLHDVIENGPRDVASQIERDFSRTTVHALIALTKRRHESYGDYISRVARNPIARIVKIADIKHNLSCQPKPERIPLYQSALVHLNAP